MPRETLLHPHRNNRLTLLIVLAIGAIALSLILFFYGKLPHIMTTDISHPSHAISADYQAFSAKFRDPQMLHFFES